LGVVRAPLRLRAYFGMISGMAFVTTVGMGILVLSERLAG
jgi:hypothetical protein